MYYKKPNRRIDRVFIHCSASDNPNHDDISVIREWHKKRGFSDVAYHYFINKKNEIQIGRSLERTPAAQRNHNKNTIAICLSGLEVFQNSQFHLLRRLCYEIDTQNDVTFHGHCEVSNKTCPNFDYRGILGLNLHGELIGSKPAVFSCELKKSWWDKLMERIDNV